jgi:hypothetical protein
MLIDLMALNRGKEERKVKIINNKFFCGLQFDQHISSANLLMMMIITTLHMNDRSGVTQLR